MIIIDSAEIGYEKPIIKVSAVFDGKSFLLGPNGAGKTTLFRGVAGIARVFSGRIEIPDGRPKLVLNLSEILEIFPSIKARELISLRADLLRSSDKEMKKVFTDVLGFPKEILERKTLTLSSGEKKALLNSIALGSEARNVLLDEPFEALDPSRKVTLMNYLDEDERTVVVNTHETSFVERLSGRKVYLMFEGRLYGPIEGERLKRLGIVTEERDDALVCIEARGSKICLIEGEGRPLTSVYSLDQIYLLGGAL